MGRVRSTHDFVEYLRANAPDVEVLEVRTHEISVRTKDGSDGVIFLPSLFAAVAKTDAGDRAARVMRTSRTLSLTPPATTATGLFRCCTSWAHSPSGGCRSYCCDGRP
jgi:hypothetical protein